MVGVVNARLVGVSVVCVAVCDSSVSRLRGRAGVDGGMMEQTVVPGWWRRSTGTSARVRQVPVSSCPARPAFWKTPSGTVVTLEDLYHVPWLHEYFFFSLKN